MSYGIWNIINEVEYMKKKLIYITVAVFMALAVLGAWLSSINSGFTGYVISTEGSPMVITMDFTDMTLDTVNSSVKKNTTAEIDNKNGLTDMVLTFNVTKVDTPDSCTDYMNDVNTTLFYDGSKVVDGATIGVSHGIHTLTAEMDAKQKSCPQNVSVLVVLNEV